MAKKIALSRGEFAIVDAEDYEWLNRWKWYASWNRSTKSYTARRRRRKGEEGESVHILMHRQILATPNDKEVDHINHNTLDNRKCNIRNVSGSVNAHNRQGVRGYTWHKRKKKWMAAIKLNGKSIFLGYFDNELKARKVYLIMKIILCGPKLPHGGIFDCRKYRKEPENVCRRKTDGRNGIIQGD